MPAQPSRPTFALALSAATGAAAIGYFWRKDRAKGRREVARIHRTLVEILLNTLNSGDAETERHSRRVADLTDAIAATYGMAGHDHSRLRVAALLHDLGKIDDTLFPILHSWRPLNEKERKEIERHPRASAEILRPLEQIHPGITDIVRAHHECWNGSGYPDRLAGAAIPLEARIISVADVFDALTQPRAYRDPLSPADALDQIRKGAGSRFDPSVVDRLARRDVLARWAEIQRGGRIDESEESANDRA